MEGCTKKGSKLQPSAHIYKKVYDQKVAFSGNSTMLSIQQQIRLTLAYDVCIRRMGGLSKVVELAGGSS